MKGLACSLENVIDLQLWRAVHNFTFKDTYMVMCLELVS